MGSFVTGVCAPQVPVINQIPRLVDHLPEQILGLGDLLLEQILETARALVVLRRLNKESLVAVA